MTVSFMKQPVNSTLFIDEVLLKEMTVVKILGVYIQQNLKWDTHVSEMLKKCNRRIYMLCTLKRFNLPTLDLITVYVGYIRPILEYCVPVFNSSLTRKQINDIEKVQKRVCKIILGPSYTSYKEALYTCNILSLEERRKKLCFDFALKLEKSPRFSSWLPDQRQIKISLRNVPKYVQLCCKTDRLKRSAIPYFIQLLNDHYTCMN